jgi:hypothetical protein
MIDVPRGIVMRRPVDGPVFIYLEKVAGPQLVGFFGLEVPPLVFDDELPFLNGGGSEEPFAHAWLRLSHNQAPLCYPFFHSALFTSIEPPGQRQGHFGVSY